MVAYIVQGLSPPPSEKPFLTEPPIKCQLGTFLIEGIARVTGSDLASDTQPNGS